MTAAGRQLFNVAVLADSELLWVADSLVEVPGVAGVMLGGSRARGAEHPDSDVDLGLYYRHPLDLGRLQQLAETVGEARSGSGPPSLTQPGAWGRWVDGGGWLTIDGMSVDWIYRDLDRVQRSCTTAQEGSVRFHFQVGHPLGVPDVAYAGEVALGVVLADPSGELTALKDQLASYPPKLAQAGVGWIDEAWFLLGALEKSATRGDVAFVAGSLFRVIGLCAHALHARAGRWVISEKGLIDAAGLLPGSPPDFAGRARSVLGRLGTDAADLHASLAATRDLVSEVDAA